jgi:glycosyltransferase involved in cell wall biosynthesis
MNAELVSIIITNHNYERYLERSIASALAVDWPALEVIVVDDGSTDRSRDVIETFVPQGIKKLYILNRGQARAAEQGYYLSRGERIIFLDSDDVLDPSIVREGARIIKPGWSMIQFRMRVIDESGNPVNRTFPKYRTDTNPESIRHWATATGSYPTPPTSGNMLARSFLEKIFPLEEGMDSAIDSYFISTAPFLGDVLTSHKPLVNYRVHGRNVCAQDTLDVSKIVRDLCRHVASSRYSARVAAAHGIEIAPNRWRYSFYNLGMRIASLRLARARHPLQDDRLRNCIKDMSYALVKPQGLTPLRHGVMFIWLLGIAVAPTSLARLLVSWRFALKSRPRAVQRLIEAA